MDWQSVTIKKHREFMKADFIRLNTLVSDQRAGRPHPPVQKPVDEGARIVDLPDPGALALVETDIRACIDERRSVRKFSDEAMTPGELSWLLWATQGVRGESGPSTFRTVPSAGARHPFETYLAVNRVEGVAPGIWRYLPLSHQLVHVIDRPGLADLLTVATLGQPFAGQAAVVLAWSCIPYRAEWRYLTMAHKNSLLDVGHISQNLYLACQAAGLGTCAIAAYDQNAMDGLLALDGTEEYTVYLSPVGRR